MGVVKLADFFATKTTQQLPPEARRWEEMLHLTGAKELRVEFVRPRDGLSFAPARVSVSFERGDRRVPREIAQWDLQLDDWLIEHRAKACDPGNEAERFGYRFRELLEHPEERYGGGFFNSVLVRYLNESELSSLAPIRRMLGSVHEYRHSDSESARDCAAYIEQIFVQAAQQLSKELDYPRPQAIEILANAIAYYLDERFNVTTRKQLGFG